MAFETISRIGTMQSGDTNNGGNVTLTFDVAPSENDLVVLFGGNGDNDGVGNIGPSTAGYTQAALRYSADEPFSTGVWWKVMGGTPDTTVTGQGSGNSQEGTAYFAIVLRNADTTTPMDATPVELDQGAAQPDCPSITTVSDGAWVFAYFASTSIGSPGITGWPTGYDDDQAQLAGLDTRAHRCGISRKVVSTAGADDPSAYTVSTSGDNYCITVAVRPATVPVVASATNGRNIALGIL